MTKLDEASRIALDTPFSHSELIKAIKASPSGKITGPDGFGGKYYKAFHKALVPIILRIIGDSIENNRFSKSLYEANIFLVLKRAKMMQTPPTNGPFKF